MWLESGGDHYKLLLKGMKGKLCRTLDYNYLLTHWYSLDTEGTMAEKNTPRTVDSFAIPLDDAGSLLLTSMRPELFHESHSSN